MLVEVQMLRTNWVFRKISRKGKEPHDNDFLQLIETLDDIE